MSSPNPSSPSITSSPGSSRAASPSRRASASAASAVPAGGPQSRRPNRVALRDYYGLKSAAPVDAGSSNGSNTTQTASSVPEEKSELDAPNFDAPAYVQGILSSQNLSGVLRAEGALINEIRGLDGERKALVYDNYSKLITATETIGKMRRNMDPLTPTTSTLAPAVAYIAETASNLRERSLAAAAEAAKAGERRNAQRTGNKEDGRKEQVETVKWVLNSPRRLGRLLDKGRREEAERDWTEVRSLLRTWEGVGGVEEVRNECQMIMGSS